MAQPAYRQLLRMVRKQRAISCALDVTVDRCCHHMLSDHQKIKIQVPYILNVSVPIHNNHWVVSCWIGGAALSWQLVSPLLTTDRRKN